MKNEERKLVLPRPSSVSANHMQRLTEHFERNREPARLKSCAEVIGISQKDAFRVIDRLVEAEKLVKLSRGVYAHRDWWRARRRWLADPAYRNSQSGLMLAKLAVSMRQRLRADLAAPRRRREIEAKGLLAEDLLEEMVERGEVLKRRAPEGEILQLGDVSIRPPSRENAFLQDLLVACLPDRPEAVRLSVLRRTVLQRGVGGRASQRGRLIQVLDELDSQGRVETTRGLGWDRLVRRKADAGFPGTGDSPEMFGGLIRDPGLADEAAPLRAMLQIISRERVGIRACRVVATSADGLDHRSVACLLPRLVRSGHVDKVKRGRHSLHRLSADGRRLLDWLDAHSGDGGGTACRSLA